MSYAGVTSTNAATVGIGAVQVQLEENNFLIKFGFNGFGTESKIKIEIYYVRSLLPE